MPEGGASRRAASTRQCPFLYAYDAFGRTYVGCTQEIFAADIDVEVLERARRRRNGFGSVRAVREPLPICPADVERAYENREDPMGCINPEFHELPDRPELPRHPRRGLNPGPGPGYSPKARVPTSTAVMPPSTVSTAPET